MLADLLDELPMDDAAEFLEDLPDPKADRLLDLMEDEEAQEVRELLGYEDETAGRLMSTGCVCDSPPMDDRRNGGIPAIPGGTGDSGIFIRC